MSGGGVTDRLPRLLSLVPYLRAHPGIPVAEAAADFGVDERQLRRDLELLWMCGLPGYGPGDLVDLSFAGDTVTVIEDAGMRRPLRLTTAEATALLVALRTLHETPGLVDSDAVARATGKIEAAVGDVAGPSRMVALPQGAVTDVGAQEEATTTAVRTALEAGRALRIVYYTAGRDAVSRRVVDPMRLLLVEGRGYLEAWCRRAEGVRLFRLDRVEDVERLDEPAQAHPEARPTDVSEGLFRPEEGQRTAVLELTPDAYWIAEYYPVDDVVEAGSGAAAGGPAGTDRIRVLMRYADPAWLVRLVLGLGGAARILDPPDLAATVAQRAREALDREVAGG
ncbi:YafY family protein [Pseudonocardia sp. KRD291]|uniref:helix-turn-helix transcriptional regulator n=1 Tax=Pseudonocardia sp. KRD291 TaxID=2792007 RepID=UPI001C4A578A|nr:WYL domain-containing protein [Pseudonocardia sp. KRD291]MBW0102246.1 WYL domain-containing protein [Pseudonocardia sp. KRD291]